MLTYELAKKLKEAGFPQKKIGYVWFFRKAVNNYFIQREAGWLKVYTKNADNLKNEWYFVPTLEELIEACGDRFEYLYRADEDMKEVGIYWICGQNPSGEGDEFKMNPSGQGKTPSEAVANLWLQLNKK